MSSLINLRRKMECLLRKNDAKAEIHITGFELVETVTFIQNRAKNNRARTQRYLSTRNLKRFKKNTKCHTWHYANQKGCVGGTTKSQRKNGFCEKQKTTEKLCSARFRIPCGRGTCCKTDPTGRGSGQPAACLPGG